MPLQFGVFAEVYSGNRSPRLKPNPNLWRPKVSPFHSRSWAMSVRVSASHTPFLSRFRGMSKITPLALTLGLISCGGVADLTSTGGNTNLNLTSPFTEINLAPPAELPAPDGGAGAGAIAAGANFSAMVIGENVTQQSNLGRFDPNWDLTTKAGDERLAYATYWLDMSDTTGATQLVLDWLREPRTDNTWIGLANWDTDRWTWKRPSAADSLRTVTLDPFIRDSDMMLACTILIIGTQSATLTEISTDGTNNEPPPPPPSEELLNLNAHLGINLGAVSDYAPYTPFVDVFRTAREWIPQDVVGGAWDNGNAITTDENGWVTRLDPGQAVAAIMMTNVAGIYPSGEYICLYDGSGTLEFLGDATETFNTPGRIGVNITPSGGIVRLRITSTDELDYVRNIRLIMPGFENTYETQPFHPEFLASVADFDVLRFMDWGRTNHSEVKSWSDRTTLDTFTQARIDGPNAGVCFELMADLSNTNLSDAWINMPYLADDDFVRNAAILMRDRLDPRLRVYVEYSNEVWNNLFPGANYARDTGLALNLSENTFTAQLRFYAKRSQEIHAIFSEVFENEPERLVRVAAGQSSNPWTGTTIMDYNGILGTEESSTVADRYDVYATAPYFGGYLGRDPHAATTVGMTIEEVLSACDADSQAVNGLGGHTETNALNATDRGISLIAYEGGQHLVGVGANQNNDTLTDLFVDSNRDMGMRQLYRDDLTRWDSSGGGLFMAFSHVTKYNKYGSWGALEAQNQDESTAPKLLGMLDWLAEVSTPAE